jgi:threonine aldolase
MNRRMFLSAPAASALAAAQTNDDAAAPDRRVFATGEGIWHSPQQYGALLARLTQSGTVEPDNYSNGGAVQTVEKRFADLLGKEMAVWLPTGTLANHLAVRLLAGERRRVLVQAESHLFNDSGDCAQTLSGLHLVPLAPGRATFRLEDAERAHLDAQLGRVPAPVGAISIETPVRRLRGERFDWTELQRISTWARERRIGLHLDGARLFVESVYAGRDLEAYTALADTVFVSMWKCFNSAAGAVLAGPSALLSQLSHTRRMFGGSLPHAWPDATVALHFVDSYRRELAAARQIAEKVIADLSTDANFALRPVANGTNQFQLRAQTVNPPVYAMRLQEAGITAGAQDGGWFTLHVNPTWTRVTADELVSRFRQALGY